MNKQKITGWLILIFAAGLMIMIFGCAHVKEIEYYETGQTKKETEKYGILFSEGKEFSIIEIN